MRRCCVAWAALGNYAGALVPASLRRRRRLLLCCSVLRCAALVAGLGLV